MILPVKTERSNTLVLFSHRRENRLPEKKHPSFDLLLTGCGKDSCIRNLESRLKKFRYERIVNIGVCGALDASIPLLSIHAVKRVQCASHSPDRPPRTLPHWTGDSGELPGTVLVTSEKPVASLAERERLREHGALLVDMECYHLAEIASRQGIPFFAFKAVSDHADARAFDQFRRNAEQASVTLCRFLWPWIRGENHEF